MTLWVGTIAGVMTAVIGGALSWYFFFNPMSWSLANEAWIPLLGFAVIASVIISTSHLYRASERRHHERELTRMQLHAESAEFFAREMAHRLKNALAIVQGIAHQTLGNESDASRKFSARLQTLAEANALLTEDVDNPTADVKAVIETAIRPFREPSRFNINGVSAQISSQQVVSLALALHELCTNASKYGALSVRSGQVFIDVEDAGETLKLVWREQGGPLVSEPATQGFGSRLLLRAGFQTTLHFQPEGLSCKMDVRKA
jgi:two-component sensor histidine kinase